MGIHVANIDYLVAKAMAKAWAPPPPVDYLAWAKQHVVFSERESPSFPGPYNEDLFPYFSEVLRALSPDDPCRTVTLIKSAQLGGTVLANIFTGCSLDLAPGDFLYVHPTEGNARRWSKTKLKVFINGTPVLKRVFPTTQRDGSDSVLYKERIDGLGAITISGANSPASLSMMTVPRQVQDDLAKWEMNSAGDPESQANSRSRGVEFAKLFKISTPLVMPGCRISNAFEDGSQEYFHVPCPHCDHCHVLTWENMLENLDEAHPEKAHFTCLDCGCVIEEHHRAKMIRRGEWIAENPGAKRQHRSFHIWSAYSALQSFERLANEWFTAKGDPAKEQTFLNDSVGEAYKTEGDAPPWEELRDRAIASTYARASIPARAIVLTMGIDCQKDRIEWQVVGWGRNGYRAVIDCGVVPWHIGDKDGYPAFDKLLKMEFVNSVGRKIAVDRTAIDGNAWTEDVWDWSKRHPVSKLIMVRGAKQETAPLIALVKKQRSADGKRILRYARRFYNFNSSILKMRLYRKVRKTDQTEFGYVDFPRGFDDDYFMQLTAERRVPKLRNGFTQYIWEKDKTQPNEMLDTMNQAETAANNLKVSAYVDAQWERLEAERLAPIDNPQMDFEEMPLALPIPPQKRGRRVRSRGI